MRITVLTGIFAFVAIVATHASVATAQVPNLVVNKNFTAETSAQKVLTTIETQSVKAVIVAKLPVIHEIGPSDSLSTIAKKYDTTWVRLFNKNPQLANPDMLTPSLKITIPEPNEQLVERPLPEPPKIVPATVSAPVKTKTSSPSKKTVSPDAPISNRGSSSGNTYSAGYCTWYAKNLRPDLPNNLGNANTWVARAAAQGLATGSTPRVGAIGQQGMHVVFVQQVNDDGTVTISEMNYRGLYVVSTRTVPANTFQYVY